MASKNSGCLKEGQVISTMNGRSVIVKHLLGQGGQGRVYLVDYDGEEKALKWYFPHMLFNKQQFKESLKENISKTPPASEFLWPCDLAEMSDGSFGYVMDLRPAGYFEATEFLIHKKSFVSYRRAIDACLNVVSAFRQLHLKGYCYKDINGGNFFFDPKTGKALICDCDNIGSSAYQTGVKGTPSYMAPEVARDEALPNTQSDLYSMAVLIFMLLCKGHPLEGKRVTSLPVLDAAHQMKLYGTDPVFVMDPYNSVNEPNPVVHATMLYLWKCLPGYVRDMFINAFSYEALHNAQLRPTEEEWLPVLARFRSDIVTCTCGNEVFTNNGALAECDKCHRRIRSAFVLALSGYRLPLVRDTRLYRCQVAVTDASEGLSPVAHVGPVIHVDRNGQRKNELVIQNVSDETWDAITSKGVPRKVKPKESIPVKPGICFKVGIENIRIEENG